MNFAVVLQGLGLWALYFNGNGFMEDYWRLCEHWKSMCDGSHFVRSVLLRLGAEDSGLGGGLARYRLVVFFAFHL